MESVRYLLNHPFIVLNNVAEVLYEQKTPAYYARLRSRAIGRHRFKEEEYKQLTKIFTQFGSKINKTADKLELLTKDENPKKNILPVNLLHLPMLNVKQLLTKSAENTSLNYFRIYDSLRYRTKLSDTEIKAIINNLRLFVKDIELHLDLAKKEAKTYSFVLGRGSKSHILA
ncbi:MAG: hypothetical protein IPM47_17260 [Sphingobacteriales bacterium]|nr:MAG: hypothetical protein IPM47_17260 [Sphingobacteriales bacterium]